MNLAIDIGNTYTKIAVFEQYELLHAAQYQNVDTGIINIFLKDYKVKGVIISSVKKENAVWQTALAEKVQLIYFNTGMTKGIINHYLTP